MQYLRNQGHLDGFEEITSKINILQCGRRKRLICIVSVFKVFLIVYFDKVLVFLSRKISILKFSSDGSLAKSFCLIIHKKKFELFCSICVATLSQRSVTEQLLTKVKLKYF